MAPGKRESPVPVKSMSLGVGFPKPRLLVQLRALAEAVVVVDEFLSGERCSGLRWLLAQGGIARVSASRRWRARVGWTRARWFERKG